MKFILLLFFTFSAFAVDAYKIKPGGYSAICDNSHVVVSNLPPVRDQGSYGLCYAHSGILLLDHLRCSTSPSPDACYAEPGSVLHLAKFQSSETKIEVGGHTGQVLTNFLGTKKLATEKCAEYDDWKNLDQHYQEERRQLPVSQRDLPEMDYFYYISKRLKQNAGKEELSCWAREIVDAGVNQNISDVMAVLEKGRNMNWKELRYHILVPKSCLAKTLSYPDYTVHSYPSYSEQKSFKGFRDFIFRALSLGVPVEASFKAEENGYHSSTITGQRHVCDKSKCELQYRIQNSYGKSWQEYNDDGWVNAENLVNLMGEYSLGVMAILPKGKSLNQKISSPYYVSSPLNPKYSFSSSEQCWKEGKSVPAGVWTCTRNGETSFSSNPIPGWFCKHQ